MPVGLRRQRSDADQAEAADQELFPEPWSRRRAKRDASAVESSPDAPQRPHMLEAFGLGTPTKRWEQIAGVAIAVFGAGGFLSVWIPELSGPHRFADAPFYLAGGLAICLVLAVASLIGKTWLMAASGLLMGIGPWGADSILGLPAIALGGWLLIRSSRRQRAKIEAERRAHPERDPRVVREQRRRQKAEGTRAAPRGPQPNKRYTPPKQASRHRR
jgi:hypothetical protein